MTENNPVEVFSGTAWEVGLVESLLENADIRTYAYYGGNGTMAPWDSGGGKPVNRIMVASDDIERAKELFLHSLEEWICKVSSRRK